MKTKYASILLTLICLLGLSVAAKAQIRDRVVVTLPFEFVVGGQMLPAGKYILSSFSDDPFNGLILSNVQDHISVIVRPVEIGNARAEKVSVDFEQVGEQHVLTQVHRHSRLRIHCKLKFSETFSQLATLILGTKRF